MRAIGASACEMCTAPIITSRTGGTWTVRNQLSPSCSTVALLPAQRRRQRLGERIAGGGCGVDEPLLAVGEPGDQRAGAPLAARGVDRLQELEPHPSTRST